MAALGKKNGVDALYSALDSRRLNRAMVDEEKDCSLFDMIIGIRGPTRRRESPFSIADVEFHQLVSNP